MKPDHPKLRHYAEATALWLIPAMLRPLPFTWRVRVGGAFVAGLIRLVPNLRRRIRDNLALIYPDMPAPERKALLRNIARHIGWSYIEMLYSHSFIKRTGHFHLQSDIAPLLAARAEGRPIILVSAHFGNWDAIRGPIQNQFGAIGALFKRPDNPILGRRYEAYVSAGNPMFEVTPRGMAEMVRFLKTGGVASILNDQRAEDGEWLDFMGQPALTALSAAKLAIRTDALLVPCYALRRENRQDFDVYFEAPVAHGDPVEMTRELNDSLSAKVRAHPEQWYWLHRRWKDVTGQILDNHR